MGGNIFKGKTQGIKKENIEPTVAKYFEELKSIFPKKAKYFNKKHFIYLGSVGKKPVSGDIDFGIDVSTMIDKDFSDKSIKEWGLNPKEVKDNYAKFKKRARTATDAQLMLRAINTGIAKLINASNSDLHTDEKKAGSANVFGYFPQYTPKGEKLDYGVQIDWMISDIELLKFSYYSAVYKGNVKGLHRTQLILAMFQGIDVSFSHAQGLKDKATGEFITKDPKEMMQVLEKGYGVKISKKCSEDYFCLIKIVNKLSKKERDKILDVYLKILDTTRADIPDDLQDEWKKRKNKLSLTGKFLPSDSKLLESLGMIRIALNKIQNEELE